MALETGTYINSLNGSNPTATDALAQADDHLRLIKNTIKNTFPNISGAVDATHTELNIMDGGTSATATTLVDADRVVVNDDGTMKQVALTDIQTYIDANMTLRADVVTTSSIADGAVATASIADDAITAAKIADGAITSAAISGDTKFHSGMVMPFAGTTAPTGWLMCYGQEVSRTTYADLYTALSTTYGSGDGSLTFNVPDLRGRVVAGQDDMGGTSANRLTSPINGDTLGATGGAEDVTLTGAESGIQSHTHDTDLVTISVGSGDTTSYTGYRYETHGSPAQSQGQQDIAAVESTTTTRSETSDAASGDATSAHLNLQPTIVLNYIIKT